SEIHTVTDYRRRAIDFEAGFVFPDQRAVAGVDAVNVMIEPAGDQAIAGNCRCRFQTVFCLKAPDQTSVTRIKAIKTAVCRTEVDVPLINRRLTRPTRATPRIFVQPAADPFRFERPDDLQPALRPRARAVKIAR